MNKPDIRGGGRFNARTVGQGINEPQVVDANRIRRIILDYDQNRQDAVPVRIDLAEWLPRLIVGFHGLGGNGDFFARLMMSVSRGGFYFEVRFVLLRPGAQHSRYTHKEEQWPS